MPNPDRPFHALSDQDQLSVRGFINGREQRLETTGAYQFDDEDVLSVGPVRCDWRIDKKTIGLSIAGNINGTLSLRCDACERPFTAPVVLEIAEVFVLDRYVDTQHGREKELLSDDFYEAVSEDAAIDLRNLVHQYLIIEISHHPTCGQDDCAECAS